VFNKLSLKPHYKDHPTDKPVLEEPILDPSLSTGMGYGESKWVAETLLLNARKAMGLNTTIVRVGQVAGCNRIGAWTYKEWVPAIVRSSQIVGAVPERPDVRNFIFLSSSRKLTLSCRSRSRGLGPMYSLRQ
jgi:thioester reductase-like protein